MEEQFYLLFPRIVAMLALRPTPAEVVGAMLLVLFVGMALRGWFWVHDVAPPTAGPKALIGWMQ